MNAGTASRLRTLLKAKQSLPTSNRTSKRPSPPRGAARLAIARSDGRSRLTKDVVGGFFTLNIRIVFGHGCDYPRYVPEVVRHSGVLVNLVDAQIICNNVGYWPVVQRNTGADKVIHIFRDLFTWTANVHASDVFSSSIMKRDEEKGNMPNLPPKGMFTYTLAPLVKDGSSLFSVEWLGSVRA